VFAGHLLIAPFFRPRLRINGTGSQCGPLSCSASNALIVCFLYPDRTAAPLITSIEKYSLVVALLNESPKVRASELARGLELQAP
jgi:hypothetical protein